MDYEGIVRKGLGKAGEVYNLKTANLEIENLKEKGVYIGVARIENIDKVYSALICLGARENLLEAHLHGYSGNLYGKAIKVSLQEKLRELLPYEDERQMKKIIESDYQVFIKKIRV